jgi:hypothetical protein
VKVQEWVGPLTHSNILRPCRHGIPRVTSSHESPLACYLLAFLHFYKNFPCPSRSFYDASLARRFIYFPSFCAADAISVNVSIDPLAPGRYIQQRPRCLGCTSGLHALVDFVMRAFLWTVDDREDGVDGVTDR